MNKQTVLFGLLLQALLPGSWGDRAGARADDQGRELPAGLHRQHLVTTRFTQGKRTERLESDYAEYYQVLEQSTFDKPVVV